MSSGEKLPGPVFAESRAAPENPVTALPLASAAEMVTGVGAPATMGEGTVLTAKWWKASGMTWMPRLVMLAIVLLVRSEAVSVWVPTVPSRTLN